MSKICTVQEMMEREQYAVDKGIALLTLMENAGQRVAQSLRKKFSQKNSFTILCGKGNNGGDGLVIARALIEEQQSVNIVFLLGEQLSDLASINQRKLPLSVVIVQPEKFREYQSDVVIDAVFGTGYLGELNKNIQDIFNWVNQNQSVRVALDLPSGINGDTGQISSSAFKADITYTFDSLKPAHIHEEVKKYCGEIICLDIGIPED